jgi:serine/threonine-protein kinase
MEFVEGLSLDRLVAQTGPLPVAQACQLIRQAAIGLVHVHEQGMIHRDIKPQNLMVGRKGNVKVLDFGLARLATDEDTSATTEGMILGTPDYIAPEQAANARAADIRSDIYSLGCTLYFSLTGQPPFPKGSFVEKLTLHSTKEPEPIRTLRPDVPAELAEILARMMAKDPRRRYQTPVEVAKELAAFVRAGTGSRESGVGSREPANEGRESPPALPPLDPLASLDLAAATPLRPVAKPGHQSTLPFSQQQLVTLLAIAGAAIVLLLLAIPLAGWLWPSPIASTNRQQPIQRQVPSTPAATRPTKSPPPPPILKSAAATTPPATVAIAEPSSRDNRPYRALFVIPTTGLYLPDYNNTYQALRDAKIDVQVAARTDRPSTLKNDPGGIGPSRDVPYGDNLLATDYDFIVFTGYETFEFAPGGTAAITTRRLLDEFKKDGKLVTAICRGQQILAEHGELKGKTVARCIYVDAYERIQPFGNDVEADGQVVTAAADKDARDFVAKIIQTLDAR